MHTNTFRKVLTSSVIAGLTLTSGVHATIIGSGSVENSGALLTDVNWNDTFTTGSATGSVNGLTVTAQVIPTLNMVISGNGVIALGNLTSSAYSSGSVNVEVGTNAANGAAVSARSSNGGLRNLSDPTQFINNLTTDEVADSYKFASAIGAADDSAFASFTQTANLDTEVSDSSTSHGLYTSNKPQSLSVAIDDFSFSVSAKPDIQTPAGNYNDVVVVTVTGNF